MISYEEVPMCKNCERESFKKVKNYIEENGSSTPNEIHRNTRVPLKVIDYFVRSGSLYNDNKKLTEEEEKELERKKRLETLEKLKNALSPYENAKSDKENQTTDKNGGMRFIGTSDRYR